MPADKIESEKRTIRTMIGIYCKAKHHNADLCCECEALLLYAIQRLDHCKLAPDKPFCKHCKVHCYKPDQRETIRKVMRYAGPRMVFYQPLVAFKHIFSGIFKITMPLF